MYRELDDNEILYMIKENDDYYEILLEKYKPMIIGICKKYKKQGKEIGYELEDLIQVASIGLIDAIKSYSNNQDTLFYTYLVHCIKNKLNTEIRDQKTKRKLALNEAISYDKTIPGTEATLLDVLPNQMSLDPLKSLIIDENQIEYIHFINSLPFEVALVYELRVNGFSLDQISEFARIDKRDISKYLRFAKKEYLSKISKNLYFSYDLC